MNFIFIEGEQENSSGKWIPIKNSKPILTSNQIISSFEEEYSSWKEGYREGLDKKRKNVSRTHPYYSRMPNLMADRQSRSFDASIGNLYQNILRRMSKKRGTFFEVSGEVKRKLHRIDLITNNDGIFTLFELRLGSNTDSDKSEKTADKILGDSDVFCREMNLADESVIPSIGVILPISLSYGEFCKSEGLKICSSANKNNVLIMVLKDLWEFICGIDTFSIIDEELKKLAIQLDSEYLSIKTLNAK